MIGSCGFSQKANMNSINTDPLSELANKYGSDKCPKIKHSYTPIYYQLFKDKRQSTKKVLEIGIGLQGASLKMWRDFFPNAGIYGADILPQAMFEDVRIKSFICDQTNKDQLESLTKVIGTDIDLVIDDGSHITDDQITTCTTLMPLLNKNVIYIIEDVTEVDKIISHLSELGYKCTSPITRGKFRDDNIVIVKHNVAKPNITIFAKPAFLDIDQSKPFKYEGKPPEKGRLMRISSTIRGEQVANFIGAKYNPTEDYQNDICIYVKPPHKVGQPFLFEGKKAYLDILDAPEFYDLLRKYPEVGVISCSEKSFNTLKDVLPNEIVNIPEHHCNFERLRRNRKGITTVGTIRNSGSFKYMPDGMKERLAERGIEFLEFAKIFSRADVVNFYLNIDIQIIWRPYMNQSKNELRNPMRVINSSSFGIPTIMYEEASAEEMDGCYIPVLTLEDFLKELDKLRSNPNLYEQYAKRCIEKSEEYHIDNIAKLYRNLAPD
jgi:hypothetical protein